MSNWIPFEDATYLVEKAFVLAADKTAAVLEQAVITVFTGRGGKKGVSGTGRIRNILLVQLLEDHDDVDLILDLGGEFKYYLTSPDISGGKVFAPDTESSVQFSPTSPWRQIPEDEFDVLVEQLKIL
ncbi:MAG: hypothetical protein JSW04_13800 [Desulfobacterales bacterium]|nr:MAG: hypothetical protein JSV38_11555 [Desulfobacterales bacterium]UCD89471.1 MAG: hypothetical protein JSW04_13800 [Desulfobacterales bacterium]